MIIEQVNTRPTSIASSVPPTSKTYFFNDAEIKQKTVKKDEQVCLGPRVLPYYYIGSSVTRSKDRHGLGSYIAAREQPLRVLS